MTTDPWRDDLTAKTDMDGCMVCSSPTNSHLLLFNWDGEDEVFRATTNHEAADAYGHVCHGCYTDEDGDHCPILQQYSVTVQRLCDQYDIPVRMLVEAPGEVQEIMDADDWGEL